MGTGRTLRKHSHTRPVKSPGEKRRRSKAQRSRLVKLGMDAAVVAKMQSEDVRKLVLLPAKVKKLLAPKAPKAPEAAKPAPAAEAAAEQAPKAKKAAAPKAPKAAKPAAEPKAKKPAAPKAKAAKKAE